MVSDIIGTYWIPPAGETNHVSANEHVRYLMFLREKERHRKAIEDMICTIDNTEPKVFHKMHEKNPKKIWYQFMRHRDIEFENIRLLGKMSKIMVRSKDAIHGVFKSGPSDLLKSGSRQRNACMRRDLLNENQALLRRLLERKPCYSCVEWMEHTTRNEDLKQQICKYPHTPFPSRLLAGGSKASRPSSAIPTGISSTPPSPSSATPKDTIRPGSAPPGRHFPGSPSASPDDLRVARRIFGGTPPKRPASAMGRVQRTDAVMGKDTRKRYAVGRPLTGAEWAGTTVVGGVTVDEEEAGFEPTLGASGVEWDIGQVTAGGRDFVVGGSGGIRLSDYPPPREVVDESTALD